MKKITFVITKSNFGGAQKYVYELAKACNSDSQFEVSVLVGGEGELVEMLRSENINVQIIKSLERDINPFKEISAFFDLVKILKRIRPDILHINSSKIAIMGSIAGRILNIPKIIFTIHGWPFNDARFFIMRSIFWLAMILPIMLSDKVIAVSEAVRKQTPLFAFFHRKVKVIYLGVEKKEASDAERNIMIEKISAHEKPRILSIGELTKNKGHDIAIKSLASMKDVPWTYHIMGEGEDKEKLFKIAREHEVESRVILHGAVPEAAKYMSLFDIFYHPSRTEAGSYVTLEALNTQMPIIVHNVGGLPELIERQPLTYLLDHTHKNYEADLRKAIHESIEMTAVRDAKKFTLENMIRETKELYFS